MLALMVLMWRGKQGRNERACNDAPNHRTDDLALQQQQQEKLKPWIRNHSRLGSLLLVLTSHRKDSVAAFNTFELRNIRSTEKCRVSSFSLFYLVFIRAEAHLELLLFSVVEANLVIERPRFDKPGTVSAAVLTLRARTTESMTKNGEETHSSLHDCMKRQTQAEAMSSVC